MKPDPILVVKVGGSLFDLPDLKPRLRRWLRNQKTKRILLVPGGGAPADYVRHLQRTHGLKDEAAHDLALEAMTFNGRLLHGFFPKALHADCWSRLEEIWTKGQMAIPEVWTLLLLAETRLATRCPRSWKFTSDSVAAVFAIGLKADRLVLLKSRAAKPGLTWKEHAADGLVDAFFPRLAAKLPRVDLIDFRGAGPAASAPPEN